MWRINPLQKNERSPDIDANQLEGSNPTVLLFRETSDYILFVYIFCGFVNSLPWLLNFMEASPFDFYLRSQLTDVTVMV